MNLAASQTGTSKADGKTTIPDKNVYIYLNSLKNSNHVWVYKLKVKNIKQTGCLHLDTVIWCQSALKNTGMVLLLF